MERLKAVDVASFPPRTDNSNTVGLVGGDRLGLFSTPPTDSPAEYNCTVTAEIGVGGAVNAAAFHPELPVVAAAGFSGGLALHSTAPGPEQGELVGEVATDSRISSLTFNSPTYGESPVLAAGSSDTGEVHFYGIEVKSPPEPTTAPTRAPAPTPAPRPNRKNSKKKSNKGDQGLVIGLSVAAAVVVVLLVGWAAFVDPCGLFQEKYTRDAPPDYGPLPEPLA